MKKLNHKGFSLIELLAVIVILGILFGIGLGAYNLYTESAKKQAAETLLKSSVSAAESYVLDHPGADSVDFSDLVEGKYLENASDPYNKSGTCTGVVSITKEAATHVGQVDKRNYIVDMCCANQNYQYSSQTERVSKTTICMSNYNETDHLSPNYGTTSGECTNAKRKTKSFWIYTMSYINKVCDKNAEDKYGACYDSGDPNGNYNYPCRRYKYYEAKCTCTYSKTGNNRLCASSTSEQGKHTMLIKYQENTNGHKACNSDSPDMINSYVQSVCHNGIFTDGNTVITFHGYQFFRGHSTGYQDFRPEGTWFHSNINGLTLEDRVPRREDIMVSGELTAEYEQGCRDTCVRYEDIISPHAS